MYILIFFVALWYFSLFFQTFFNHRYAAHSMFSMSKRAEKVFYVLSWIGGGSSYLSPRIYGIMHRMHHAYADTEKDPHSPMYSKGLWDMMWKTKELFSSMERGENIDPKFTKNLPDWESFDHFASSWFSRIMWGAGYVAFFIAFSTHWSMYLLLPFVFIMSPVHGAIINWFAHKFGYRNFEVSDTSMNLMPVDIFMLGEGFHNNHHKYGARPNFGVRWFEFDPIYPIIKLLAALKVIEMNPSKETDNVWDRKLSRQSNASLQAAFTMICPEKLKGINFKPEEKFKMLIKSWEKSLHSDWKENTAEYLRSVHLRENLQEFLKGASRSLRKKLEESVAPLEKLFEEKLRSIGPDLQMG